MNRSHPENLPETPSARRSGACKGGLFQANLKAYLDGEISAIRGWLVRGHLAHCAECREELRWLRRLGEDMKELESTRPRPELRARILASLPSTPPAPGIRVVYSRPDYRESAPRFMPRLALASGLAMLLAFSVVFALKRASGVAAPGQTGSKDNVRNNAQPRKAALDPTDAQESDDPGLKYVTYTPPDDPNNTLADKLADNEMAEIERAKRLAGQDDWHRLLAQARTVARATDTTMPTEMGVALAVPNIAAVRAHLPTWAKQEGATFVATGNPNPPGVDKGTLLPPRTDDSAANMIAFYVPAQHGPAFLGALNKLGQISILSLAPRPQTSASLKPAPSVQPALTLDGQRKAIPTAPVNTDSGAPTEKTALLRDKNIKAGHYLVLTVLLTAARN